MPDMITTAEDQQAAITFAAMFASDSDPSNDAYTVTSVGTPVGGTVSLVNGTITFTPAADFHGMASFDYVMVDGSGTSTNATKMVEVTSVNDRAVIHGPAATSIPVSGSQTIPGLSISDVDALTNPAQIYHISLIPTHGAVALGDGAMPVYTDPIIGTGGFGSDDTPWLEFSAAPPGAIYFSGTMEEVNAALTTVTFTAEGGFEGAGSLVMEVLDSARGGAETGSGGSMTTSRTLAMNVGVNAAPDVANLDGDTAAFVEDGSFVFLDVDTSALVTDDNANFAGGKLSVKIVENKNSSEDVIAFDPDWEATGILYSEDDEGVGYYWIVDNVIIGSGPAEYGTQGDDISITLNENATAEVVTRLIQALTYNNIDTIDPSAATRKVEISLTDGDGEDAQTTIVSTFVTVEAKPELNHAPLMDLNGNAAGDVVVAYTENRPTPLRITSTATVVDNDPRADFNGGFLEIAITGATATERLSILTSSSIQLDGHTVLVSGSPIGTLSGGDNGTPLKITFYPPEFTGKTAKYLVDDVINSIGYANSSDAPPAQRTITFTLNDGGGTENGGTDTAVATATVNITAVEDAVVAGADAASVNENGIVTIDVLANDIDPDGPAPAVATINGEVLADGESTTLTSGAVVTFTGGKLDYDTNDKFNDLADFSSTAANRSATDSFKYTLTSGQEVTVTVTVKGVASTGDVLRGTTGADTIDGTSGNDVIDGGIGNDRMAGGLGNDSYEVDDSGDTVVEEADAGKDRVLSSLASYTLGANVENLRGMLTSAQELTGNALRNEIVGNAGNDTLNGLGGGDRMQGNAGDDIYYVDSTEDKVIERDREGLDVVRSTVTFSLAGQYVEQLLLEGSGDINGTGNGLNNQMIGNDGNNRLNGGVGADSMDGGMGNDTYVVDDISDLVFEDEGGGTDRIDSRISYVLADDVNVENLYLTGNAEINVTGNWLNNEIHGNSAANIMNGGGGADLMVGGLGNDRYVVDNAGDVVKEAIGGGYDTVDSSVTYSLKGQYIDALNLTGSAAINGTGNGGDNVITGNSAINTLDGAAGDDKLNGGLGSDTLTGGAGIDRFVFDTAMGAGNVDRITDFNSADDTIYLDRSLFAGVNRGALNASSFFAGTGAHDANDRIVYDAATGSLFYDADGDAAGAHILFATLEPNTILTAGDFFGF